MKELFYDPYGGQISGPSGGPGVQVSQGAARDLSVALNSDSTKLIITLTPNDNALYATGADYVIYWLNPTIFSVGDVYAADTGNLAPIQDANLFSNRRNVVTVNGGDGILYALVDYDSFYQLGGWMYALVYATGSTTGRRLQGTNFVAVPPYTAISGPSATEVPTNFMLAFDFSSVPGYARVQVSWRNPGTLLTVRYMKLATVNYLNDGFYQEWATFRVNTSAGTIQGSGVPNGSTIVDISQSIVMEHNNTLPAHTTTFYLIPMSPSLVELPLVSCPNAGVSTF